METIGIQILSVFLMQIGQGLKQIGDLQQLTDIECFSDADWVGSKSDLLEKQEKKRCLLF